MQKSSSREPQNKSVYSRMKLLEVALTKWLKECRNTVFNGKKGTAKNLPFHCNTGMHYNSIFTQIAGWLQHELILKYYQMLKNAIKAVLPKQAVLQNPLVLTVLQLHSAVLLHNRLM